jgi:hypothetical protein
MRSVISLILAATFSLAAHARVYHPRVLSWDELTRLPKIKRMAYLHEIQKVLVTLEKMQKRTHVADNSDEFGRMKSQIAMLLQMSAIVPEAKADDTFEIEELEAVPPQEEVHVLRPVIKKKKKIVVPKATPTGSLEALPPQEEIHVLKPVIKKKKSAEPGGYMGIGSGLNNHLPAPVDDGHVADPPKPSNLSGTTDPVKSANSSAVVDPEKPAADSPGKAGEAGKAKFVVVPTTPFNPDGKCAEGMTWNPDSKTCLAEKADQGACTPRADSCAKLTEKQADEARLRLAHTASAGICTEGGFFSTYKNPQNPKEGCDITKGLNGLEKKLCAAGEKPCNMTLFCLAAPFDETMKERFAQAGLPFDRINKNALGKFEGDDVPAVPRSICVKNGGNVTATCVSEYNRLIAGQGTGQMPINVGGATKSVNLDGIKYKACDVLTFHSKAYDKLAIADTWRAVKKAVDEKYNDTCGNNDFRALYCDDCRMLKGRLFAAAKAAAVDPCAAAPDSSGATPDAKPSDATK